MENFYETYAVPGFWMLLGVLAVTIVVLICVAYITYAERKVMGAMQLRQGPSTVGPFGLLQPFADGLKLMMKENIVPTGADRFVYYLAPALTFVFALVAWAVIPFDSKLVLANINVGVLYLFAISSLGVYGIILAGWAPNSRYAFLGGLRSAAQMVSYEVSLGLVIVCVLLCTGTLNLVELVEAPRPFWQWILLFPMLVVFFISALAETNRAPFDLPEGESEIVGGYNVEYGAFAFALFFIGEYANMMLLSGMTVILFLGGWLPPFGMDFAPFTWIPGPVWFLLKIAVVLFCFVWARATMPRYRYDQLMRLGWKIFLPFSLVYVVFVAGVLLATNSLPGQ
ncbi:MAG TPA: NADH-quinone oxidoreductase subunit NuoH [Rhodospirillaceae bacterium]|nr:NADH-quinone oxidoreductase subunit NuoH [Rhodospirillaceae bacterium]